MSQNRNKDAAYVNDFQTPPNVGAYMASLVPQWCFTALEPTPGGGQLVTELEKRDLEITAPENYWDLDSERRFDAVVMNPPFSSKTAFGMPEGFEKQGMKLGYHILMECMQKAPVIIALMPWFTISDSDVRLRFIKSFGLISVTALPRKTFEYARIQTCIFELRSGYSGPTEFKVFDLL